MRLSNHLVPLLRLLQGVYPKGVPHDDYFPLLLVLQTDMSARNLAVVVAELIDGETVVVENDAAAALSRRRPASTEVERVRSKLVAAGWRPEDSDDT